MQLITAQRNESPPVKHPRPPDSDGNQFAVALAFWPINVSNHIFPFD
jgi:hypothetical protein